MTLRILLTDILFPNKYAKWRLVETKSFMEKYDVDILVINRINSFAGLQFNIDYEELKESHSLNQYDILIFNPAYNYLNKYNYDSNGTLYNYKHRGDYLFRKKKFNSTSFNVDNYDKIYHIFLMNYALFNQQYSAPFDKQFIHLYPGGGFSNKQSLNCINSTTKIISTQSFTTDYLKELLPHNAYINVFTGPYCDDNFSLVKKNKKFGKLNVCFTSLGVPEDKGAYIYIKVADSYKLQYADDDVSFYSVGIVPESKNIIHLDAMSQQLLDQFYSTTIDILISLDTGRALNGFPLGIEAMIQGVILFTPDHNNLNEKNNFNYGSELIIINPNDIGNIKENIHKLYADRELLHDLSVKTQIKTFQLFNYENTMMKIFKFIEES